VIASRMEGGYLSVLPFANHRNVLVEANLYGELDRFGRFATSAEAVKLRVELTAWEHVSVGTRRGLR
jgi:hypothetical protein